MIFIGMHMLLTRGGSSGECESFCSGSLKQNRHCQELDNVYIGDYF